LSSPRFYAIIPLGGIMQEEKSHKKDGVKNPVKQIDEISKKINLDL